MPSSLKEDDIQKIANKTAFKSYQLYEGMSRGAQIGLAVGIAVMAGLALSPVLSFNLLTFFPLLALGGVLGTLAGYGIGEMLPTRSPDQQGEDIDARMQREIDATGHSKSHLKSNEYHVKAGLIRDQQMREAQTTSPVTGKFAQNMTERPESYQQALAAEPPQTDRNR